MSNLKPDFIIKERYKIINILHQGKLSVLYIVSDEVSHGKICVLKEFSIPSGDNYEVLERIKLFKNYVKTIKKLNHPSLVRVLDFLEYKNKYYIVMEYIEGRTLQNIIEEETLPLKEINVLNLGIQISDALSYLHHKKEEPIILVNLHPSHIIIDQNDNIKLINFKFSKLLFDNTSFSSKIDGYISPEEYSGILENDSRSDIYSLGVILHQLLTGRDPSVCPFKLHPVRKFNQIVANKTETVIYRATQYKPAGRYQEITQLKEDLSICLKTAEDKAKSGQSISKLLKEQPARYNIFKKIILVLGGIVLLLIIIFIASMFIRDKHRSVNKLFNFKAEGINHYNSGEYSEAIDCFTKWILKHPDDAEVIIYKENSYLNLNEISCVNIAFTDSLSGEYDTIGKKMLQGIALAQNVINSEKKIPGYSLNITLKDNKGDKFLAVEQANEIIYNSSILGVIGPVEDNTSITTEPLYNLANLPQIIPFSNIINKRSYNISNSNSLHAQILAKYSVVDRGCKKITIIYTDTKPYIKEMIEVYTNRSISLGGEIVENIIFNPGNSMSREIISRLNNVKSDLIFISGDIKHILLICSELEKEHNETQVLIYSHETLLGLLDSNEKKLEGILFTTTFNPKTNDIATQKFVKMFKDKFNGSTPGPLAALSYDATLIMAKAISEGGINREKVDNYLSSLGQTAPAFIGVTGVTAFDRNKNVQKDMLLITVKNGNLQPIGIITL